MKTALAFLLISVLAFAHPTVEIVADANLQNSIKPFTKTKLAAGVWTFAGNESIIGYAKDDRGLFEAYWQTALDADGAEIKVKTEAIAPRVSDVVVYGAIGSTKTAAKGTLIARELSQVSPTFKTKQGFAVPEANIVGIVRRVIRVPDLKAQ